MAYDENDLREFAMVMAGDNPETLKDIVGNMTGVIVRQSDMVADAEQEARRASFKNKLGSDCLAVAEAKLHEAEGLIALLERKYEIAMEGITDIVTTLNEIVEAKTIDGTDLSDCTVNLEYIDEVLREKGLATVSKCIAVDSIPSFTVTISPAVYDCEQGSKDSDDFNARVATHTTLNRQ